MEPVLICTALYFTYEMMSGKKKLHLSRFQQNSPIVLTRIFSSGLLLP